MSKESKKNNFININFDVRYKEGKVDQMIMKIGTNIEIENLETLGENLNKTLKQLLLKTKYIFNQMPLKQGTRMIIFDDYITSVIEKLEDENCE